MNPDPTGGAIPPAERESFFGAQRRHRRAARLWSLAAAVAAAIAFVIALLLAPLLWPVIGLVADLLHLAVPMPDVLGAIGARVETLIDGKLTDPVALATLAVVAALPGLVMLGLMFLCLRRLAGTTQRDAMHAAVGARAPRRDDVEEMAIAARLPPPCVALIDHDACNVGILGDGAHAAVIATRGVLDPMPSALRVASPYPRLDRRVERLRALGATTAVPPQAAQGNTLIFWLLSPVWLLLGLMATAVGLACWVSLALNMRFLAMPVGALHLALRSLAA